MATSKSQQSNPWSKFGVTPKQVKKTKKLFYGKYSFNVTLKIPGIYLYRDITSNTKLKTFIAYVEEKKSYRKTNIAWYVRHVKDVDPKKVFSVWTKLQPHKDKIKVRVEASRLSICTESEETLREILVLLKPKDGEIVHISQPANEEAAAKIKDGILFVGDPKLKFRAMIRSKRYDDVVRRHIYNYIENYEGTILMSPYLKGKLLDEKSNYISGYFYVDNMECLTFLKIICPTFVGKIFPLESDLDK